MISEYGKQIKAFFHFMFKHLFEVEFGIRVSVEILIFVVIIYILSRIYNKIITKIRNVIRFINHELVMPLRVRFFEKLAFSTSNPNLQERANKIKDSFKESKGKCIGNSKKSYAKWWILIYVILVAWVTGFHYFGEDKRSSYEVLFLGENAIIKIEQCITNRLLNTDEHTIECFFHNKIEGK